MNVNLCLYFGTEPPHPSTRRLPDADVVLEPYHPLVKYGGYAETFTEARRYVYVNPTTVDPWVLAHLTDPPPLRGRDARWNLPRLDLKHPEGLAWAVHTAVEALRSDDNRCHGLFVDDIDRLLPHDGDLAIEFFARVAIEAGREPSWFVNRAFELWPRVERLDAVLLEDITPELASYESPKTIRWLRDTVIAQVRLLRERGVRVHCLGYRDQETIIGRTAPDEALRGDLEALVDSVICGADRMLHEWQVSTT